MTSHTTTRGIHHPVTPKLRAYFYLLLPWLLALPGYAQQAPQIGGGTCSSNSLTGNYTMTLTGRLFNSSATYTNLLQGVGGANFDGQSKVTIALSANTPKGAQTQTFSGTYVVQANCIGTLNLTSGTTANFNLVIYNQGNSFLIAGVDANFDYTGGGSTAPVNACSTAKLSGVYSVSANGFTLSNTTVTGVADAIGLVQFDGKGNASMNLTEAAGSATVPPLVLSGTYTISSNCSGTASLSDSKGNAYSVILLGTGVSNIAVNSFDLIIGQPGKLTLSGAAHPLYNQPTAVTALARPAVRRQAPAQEVQQ